MHQRISSASDFYPSVFWRRCWDGHRSADEKRAKKQQTRSLFLGCHSLIRLADPVASVEDDRAASPLETIT
jgi:hypothetical protein